MRTTAMAGIFLLVTGLALMPPGHAAAEDAPGALVKSTVDDVLAVIRQNRDQQTLRRLAEQKVLPHFDFAAMTQLAVGRAWRQATPSQQQALTNNFRTLLVNTYTAALSRAATGEEAVEIKPSAGQGDANATTVKTVVTAPGKPPTAIDYRMKKETDGWKVVDVVVENVSLVTNYRSTFSEQINRSGIDGLIKALENKNQPSGES